MKQEAQAIGSMGALVVGPLPGAELAGAAASRGSAALRDEPGSLRNSFALAQLEFLDRISLAAAVFNRQMRIVGLNRRCERIFGSRLKRRCDRFSVSDRPSNDRLKKAIDSVVSHSGRWPPEVDRGVIIREAEPPMMFRALPLGLSHLDRRPCYALLIFSSQHLQSVPDAGLLARAFGLTPAQARLASHLAAGTNLDATAARLGITKETARHHLKQVFLKTDTCRQSELVALLSGYWLAAREDGQ
jgi:DNA-binding CsgD family transcriptional regulator